MTEMPTELQSASSRYVVRPCNLEMDFDAYAKFMLAHAEDLNLPYSYGIKLSFFSSPLINGKALLILDEETNALLGALGGVFGTGEHNYEDREICQIEIVYVLEGYRGTRVFLRMLQDGLQLLREENPELQQIQFWIPAAERRLDRMAAKFGGTRVAEENEGGDGSGLVFYKIDYGKVDEYLKAATGYR